MSTPTIVVPVRSGVQIFGDGDSWLNWWLFPRITDDQAQDFIAEHDLFYYYSGPGMPFSNRASVRHSPGHTLITQHGGYDV